MAYFGAIADDFTGATDLAALLARSGVRVSLRLGVPDELSSSSAALEIIALKCRTSPVDAAVADARQALAWLREAGASKFYWKYCSTFDSTPEGNIGPISEAIMADLATDQTIYCPAFPENGRSIFMGNLFVGEQLLAESPMRDHPLTPMRDSNLMRLLEPQVTKPVGLINRLSVAAGASSIRSRLSELRRAGVAHVVVDAVANDDLASIATACEDLPLLTGGSALAMPLPVEWLRRGLVERDASQHSAQLHDTPAVILSGSCSSMTRRQVAKYLETGKPSLHIDPITLAQTGVEPALEWLSRQPLDSTPLVYATANPEQVKLAQDALGVIRAGEITENALAACASFARDNGRRRFVVAGGETSGAVAKSLGITQLDVGREIAPGVPWCFTRTQDVPIAITLKSGNFGRETFFADALELFQQ